jgi:APA family basic amino acid/polyamine antiporter
MKKFSISLWTAISIVIGCVIGSGVFVKPGRVLVAAGSSNSALLAWLLGGLITLAGGLTIAEIASRIPKSGGVYTYMEELYGKSWGFVCGWVQAIIYGPALMSALSLYFASLFTQFFHMQDGQTRAVAYIVLFLLSTVTALGTHYSAWISSTTTVLKLLPIAFIGVFGLALGSNSIFGAPITSTVAAGGLGTAILATLWAYDGWIQIANLAGEIREPSRNLPRAIIIGLVGVMFAYLMVNMALFHVVPVDQIGQLNERTAAVAAETLFGSMGGRLLSFGILISIFGCLNGNILTMTRVPYSMALQGNFPFAGRFSELRGKHQTPVNSILFKTVVASIMILFLNPDRITDIAMFSMYLFYGVVFYGIFKIRKTYGIPVAGNYKIPLYPAVPVFAIGGVAYICYSMMTAAPFDAAMSIGIALLGFPISYWMRKQPAIAAAAAQVLPNAAAALSAPPNFAKAVAVKPVRAGQSLRVTLPGRAMGNPRMNELQDVYAQSYQKTLERLQAGEVRK